MGVPADVVSIITYFWRKKNFDDKGIVGTVLSLVWILRWLGGLGRLSRRAVNL